MNATYRQINETDRQFQRWTDRYSKQGDVEPADGAVFGACMFRSEPSVATEASFDAYQSRDELDPQPILINALHPTTF